MKILVSEISYAKAKSTFEAINAEQSEFFFEPAVETEETLAEQVKAESIRGFIADLFPYQGPLYAALGHGAVISRYGVGHDSIDKSKAAACGVAVCNTPGVLDNAVAEHAIWMLGALARHLPRLDRQMKNHSWQPQVGLEVRSRHATILGCGRIGRQLARKLGIGLEMQVTGFDIMDTPDFGSDSGFSSYTNQLDQALASADFVFCLLPVLDSTKRSLNAEFFSKMKRGACLINSARGALVDETALYDALVSGQLSAAALDVFAVEPYQPEDPAKDLRQLDQCVLTPHVGSNTLESNAAMARTAAENIMTFLKTGTCANLVQA